jgi:predicted dehydrogenase
LFAEAHDVDQNLVYNTWQELHRASKDSIENTGQRLADALIVAVHDQMHVEVVLAFAEQGYHILCEKPMATNLNDCIKMETAIKEAGIIFGMGHGINVPSMIEMFLLLIRCPVLRYSPYSRAITEIVRSGSLGKLINIHHIEPIGYYHFAHSFVRGNWAREQDSSFSLMTKSCQ